MIEVGELFPGVISRPVPFSQCSIDDTDILERDDLERWKHIPQGGNFENPPLALRTSAKFSDAYRKLSLNKPSYTLPKTDGNLTTGAFFHPVQPRRINQLEKSRIGGYPKYYQFIGNGKTIAARIGNSVPPLFMRAIATQIRHKLWGGDPLTRYPKSMTYPEILESAWQDHLAPRDPNAPTVISTFAGGGGSSLGYSMAGYRELLAVEWDDNAVETFKLNFPDVPVYHGDIAKLSVEECMRLAGVEEGELDLLDGSPPCQGFSTAGKRILNDPRNQLFSEFVRLLCGLKPKVFVMENVPGLVKGKMKLIFAEIMRELKASGYQVRCKKLNAMYFYVPQSRERLIFIGVRNDLEVEASYPQVESRPVSVREAFSKTVSNIDAPPISDKVAKIASKLKAGDRSKLWYGVSRLPINKPANTLSKSPSQFKNYPKLLHYCSDRGINGGEFKRLGSFPDKYKFLGDWNSLQERIGNSVPPLFMRSIAEHIRNTILQPELIK